MYRNFNDQFNTERTIKVGNISSYQTNLTTQFGFLQPLGDLDIEQSQKLEQTSKFYCKIIDVKTGDRIVLNGDKYVVKSISEFNFGQYPHYRLLIVLV